MKETDDVTHRNILCCRATPENFNEMLEIEEEHFSDYDRVLNIQELVKWYNHNCEMFYVVKKVETSQVLGFHILVPIKECLYEKILKGLASDICDFKFEEVEEELHSKFYFLQQVCAFKAASVKVRVMLIGSCFKLIYENAGELVLTSPITEEGKKISSKVGFKPLIESVNDEGKQDIWVGRVNYDVFNKYAVLAGFKPLEKRVRCGDYL